MPARLAGCLIVTAALQPTFRTSTRLVEVTVVVQDADRNAVAGLTRTDFKLYDDGKEQQIALFSEQTDTNRAGAPLPGLTTNTSPAGLFSNHVDPQRTGSVTVILLDRVNSRMEDQTSARSQVIKFLSQIRPEDHVALYVLERDSVRVVHDFTSDTSALLRALSRYRARGNDPDAAESIGPETGDPDTVAFLQESFHRLDAAIVQNRVESTTLALEAIAHHLAAVRGRKNLIWLSSGFPVIGQDDHGGPLTFSQQINRAVRVVNDANIAIYPIDDRGLFEVYATPAATATRLTSKGPVVPPSALSATGRTRDSMDILAQDTGGRAFYNRNDIDTAIRSAIDDSTVTYVLGYYPTQDKWDGKFREIKVKVSRPGVQVRHRKGYMAAPLMENDPIKREQALLELARSPLAATGIRLTAQIENAAAKTQNVTLSIRVDPGSITLQKTGQNWTGLLDVVIVQSVPDGRLFRAFSGAVGLTLTAERRDLLMKDGLEMSRTLTVRPDASQVRILVRDAPTGTTGSLIVPVNKLRAQ